MLAAVQPHPRSLHAGFRYAAALRGMAWAVPSQSHPIQGRHDTPPLPPLMPLPEPDAAPLHTVTPTLRLLAAAGYRLCHARCRRCGYVAGVRSYVPPSRPLPCAPGSVCALTVLSAISVADNAFALPVRHHREDTGEDDGERKGSVMNQSLYRLQSRAGLSLASTAAGAASEDSGSVRADVLSHLVGCEERDHSHE